MPTAPCLEGCGGVILFNFATLQQVGHANYVLMSLTAVHPWTTHWPTKHAAAAAVGPN